MAKRVVPSAIIKLLSTIMLPCQILKITGRVNLLPYCLFDKPGRTSNYFFRNLSAARPLHTCLGAIHNQSSEGRQIVYLSSHYSSRTQRRRTCRPRPILHHLLSRHYLHSTISKPPSAESSLFTIRWVFLKARRLKIKPRPRLAPIAAVYFISEFRPKISREPESSTSTCWDGNSQMSRNFEMMT